MTDLTDKNLAVEYRCSKCGEVFKVRIRYRESSNALECRCGRCDHLWWMEPRDSYKEPTERGKDDYD